MECQDRIKGIRHKAVGILRIGLMYVYYFMSFYYLLLLVIHVLSLLKVGDPLTYLRLSVIHCIIAERLYVCWTIGV